MVAGDAHGTANPIGATGSKSRKPDHVDDNVKCFIDRRLAAYGSTVTICWMVDRNAHTSLPQITQIDVLKLLAVSN